MYSPVIRTLVAILGVLAGLVSLALGRYLFGAAYLLGALFLMRGLWPNIRTGWAVSAFRNGDVDRARKHLRHVRAPEKLGETQRAYFHWMSAVAALDAGNPEAARAAFLLVDDAFLRSDNDRSIMLVQRAQLESAAGDAETARILAEQARALASEAAVLAVIDQLERDLAR